MASIFRQTYTTRDKNGKRVRKKSRFYYVDYRTADGTRKRLKGFRDRAATAQLAARLEKEAEQAQIGIVDKYKDHRKRPLSEHLRDFFQSLLDKGNTEHHAKVTAGRVERVFEGCHFAVLG